jgi:hypothetical protein
MMKMSPDMQAVLNAFYKANLPLDDWDENGIPFRFLRALNEDGWFLIDKESLDEFQRAADTLKNATGVSYLPYLESDGLP